MERKEKIIKSAAESELGAGTYQVSQGKVSAPCRDGVTGHPEKGKMLFVLNPFARAILAFFLLPFCFSLWNHGTILVIPAAC